MKNYVAAILFAGVAFLALGNLASAYGVLNFGVGQVSVPPHGPRPAAQATGSPAALTPTPTAVATGTTEPTPAATVVPASTPAPAAPETASSSSIPVVVVVGLLQAVIIIGVLVFLSRGAPS